MESYRACKIVLLGDAAVGKTCLAMRLQGAPFPWQSAPTVGAAFSSREVRLADGESLHLNVWDTGGAERYRSLAPMYYRGADLALVCYDLSRPETLEIAYQQTEHVTEANVPVFVVGTKKDIGEEYLLLPRDLAAQAANGHIYVVSARNNDGVDELLRDITEWIVQRVPLYPRNRDLVVLSAESPRERRCACWQ